MFRAKFAPNLHKNREPDKEPIFQSPPSHFPAAFQLFPISFDSFFKELALVTHSSDHAPHRLLYVSCLRVSKLRLIVWRGFSKGSSAVIHCFSAEVVDPLPVTMPLGGEGLAAAALALHFRWVALRSFIGPGSFL